MSPREAREAHSPPWSHPRLCAREAVTDVASPTGDLEQSHSEAVLSWSFRKCPFYMEKID